MSVVRRTGSADETEEVGRDLATTLAAGDTILLHGDLGAGKTVFVRGVADGLGLGGDAVTSPTFTLVHEYTGGRLPLLHLDLYRLDAADLDEIGLDPELAARGVVVIEWADRLRHDVAGAVRVTIADRGDDRREITIGRGPEAEAGGARS